MGRAAHICGICEGLPSIFEKFWIDRRSTTGGLPTIALFGERQSWIPAKANNQVKDARDCLGVSSKHDRTKVVQHAGHEIKIGRMKKLRFEMAFPLWQ
jgi:hypothetical protein